MLKVTSVGIRVLYFFLLINWAVFELLFVGKIVNEVE